ncbi:MAG: hypothetical protein AAFU53_03780 [Cyanobacteria bacterium J06632_3]
MSTSVLPQLLEVDSELSSQAAALEAQLTELQEKRKGIQTVIAMFESGGAPDLSAMDAVANVATTTKTATKKASKSAASKTTAKRKATKSTSAKTTKSKATRGRPAKAKADKTVKKTTKTVAKAAAKKESTKRSGRTANWQKYVQDSYRKSPLPDVIVGVLQAQPTNVFKIADVMNVVFKEDMPKNHFLKARNRISNILSAGARDGVWYRGRGGTYSMSEKAIKAS